MRTSRPWTRALLASAVCGVLALPAGAQELSPRAYWPAPRGTQLLFVGYSYSWGDIVTDPSLPVVGVDSGSAFGGKADMPSALTMSGFDPKRTLSHISA